MLVIDVFYRMYTPFAWWHHEHCQSRPVPQSVDGLTLWWWIHKCNHVCIDILNTKLIFRNSQTVCSIRAVQPAIPNHPLLKMIQSKPCNMIVCELAVTQIIQVVQALQLVIQIFVPITKKTCPIRWFSFSAHSYHKETFPSPKTPMISCFQVGLHRLDS